LQGGRTKMSNMKFSQNQFNGSRVMRWHNIKNFLCVVVSNTVILAEKAYWTYVCRMRKEDDHEWCVPESKDLTAYLKIIPCFAWRHWGKLRKSIRIVGIPADIWIVYSRHASQVRNRWANPVGGKLFVNLLCADIFIKYSSLKLVTCISMELDTVGTWCYHVFCFFFSSVTGVH
jgi:hypothetical protein